MKSHNQNIPYCFYLLLIVFNLLLIIGTARAAESATLDGYWFSDRYSYAFKIKGDEGVAVLSNSAKYSPGQLMLKIRSFKDGRLIARQIFTDGRWYDVNGHLVSENILELRGENFIWRMHRR